MTSQVLPMLLPASIPWLSVSIWLPILAGLVIAVAGSGASPLLNQKQVRQASLAAAVLSFLVTLPILAGFIPSFEGFQFVEQVAWIDRFQIQYFLGIDGISLWFIPLTALITIVVVVALNLKLSFGNVLRVIRGKVLVQILLKNKTSQLWLVFLSTR